MWFATKSNTSPVAKGTFSFAKEFNEPLQLYTIARSIGIYARIRESDTNLWFHSKYFFQLV
jgi:hypothetical protein